MVSQGQAFFANRTELPTAESVKEEEQVKSKPKKAAPAKKDQELASEEGSPTRQKGGKKATFSASTDDWITTLTLMRKRVQQLIDYLEAKGIATKGA